VRLELDQLHVQVRVRVRQTGGRRDGEGVDRALEHPEADGADRLVVQGAQLGLRLGHPVQDLAAPPRQHDSGPGQPHPTPGAFQEPAVGLGLEYRELLGHRRRAQVQRLGHRPDGAEGVEQSEQAQAPRVQHRAMCGAVRRCAALCGAVEQNRRHCVMDAHRHLLVASRPCWTTPAT